MTDHLREPEERDEADRREGERLLRYIAEADEREAEIERAFGEMLNAGVAAKHSPESKD
jgi:hypothetical protein